MIDDGGLSYELSEDEPVTEGIVSAVTMASGRDPLDLKPLSEVIQIDALELLYEAEQLKRPAGDWHVAFAYAEFVVILHSYGVIKVRPTGAGEGVEWASEDQSEKERADD